MDAKYLLIILLIIGIVLVSGCTSPAQQQTSQQNTTPASATPQAKAQFIRVFNETGSGTKQTQPFTITNGKTVYIQFGYGTSSDNTGYAALTFFLYNTKDNAIYLATGSINNCPNTACSSNTYAYNLAPGTYYLAVNEANTDFWQIWVWDSQ
ncbi:MAG: hypothetical protein NTY99_01975 [DPANN group archaeon]|nr:hypothetical protein [DPANN group archaeon]